MRFTGWAIAALLLTSCASKSSPGASDARLNRSALYDPPTVTLIEGQTYEFEEGTLDGAGQKFHSHHSYLRALTIGQ